MTTMTDEIESRYDAILGTEMVGTMASMGQAVRDIYCSE
jgi:hypothetical protein